MMSKAGKQTISIHALPNISRSKGNQTMKFDRLTEREKHFSLKIIHKMWWKTIPRPFS